MSTYIPASLKEAHDRFETAQQEYYIAYEKAHPDFAKARTWFENFLKHDVERAIESGNPRLYAHIAVDCLIATDSHRGAARTFAQCFEVDLNEESDVTFAAGPLRSVSAALRGGVLVLTWTFDDKYNKGEEVVAVLRVPVTPDATQERRFSAPIGFDCCGAEFEYVKPAEEEDDRFIVPLELAALAIAASRPMLARPERAPGPLRGLEASRAVHVEGASV